MSILDDEKRFYARFWALHADPMLVRIFAEFGPEPFRRSSVLEGFAGFLSRERLRGYGALEIGSGKGLTALVLARHFDRVCSIDIVPDPDRERIAAFAGVENVRFVTVADNAEKARLIGDMIAFDFAYLDGDHEHDTETDFALVERCGRVLFHEYWPAQPAVMGLVDRLAAAGGRVVTDGKLALWRDAHG